VTDIQEAVPFVQSPIVTITETKNFPSVIPYRLPQVIKVTRLGSAPVRESQALIAVECFGR
jgi:hypothetical protein